MRLQIHKLSLNFILTNTLLAASVPTFSVTSATNTSDTKQHIHIESDTQSLDMHGNIITFTGNVVVTHGLLKINADKVVVTRPGGKQGKEFIDSYGDPATFYQMQDNGKPVKGHASKMHYELAKNFVVLTGNAYLEQLDSNITGVKIIYLVNEKKMRAYSEKGKRVTTMLVPSQWQDKNNNQSSVK